MWDRIDIGSTPCDEDCEQLGPNYDPIKAKAECRAFIHQLRRVYGIEPEGARYAITANDHDFGTYYEVVCKFDCDSEVASEYAHKTESGCIKWDDLAKAELFALEMTRKAMQ